MPVKSSTKASKRTKVTESSTPGNFLKTHCGRKSLKSQHLNFFVILLKIMLKKSLIMMTILEIQECFLAKEVYLIMMTMMKLVISALTVGMLSVLAVLSKLFIF